MDKIIHKTTLVFKSRPDIYLKEKYGLKPNTIRKQDTDDRFSLLKDYEAGKCKFLMVRIVNTEDETDYFDRVVNDVTYYDGYYIISWLHVELRSETNGP